MLKQVQLDESDLMKVALRPVRMDKEQEKKMREALENSTMENAEKQLKHAVAGKKKADNRVVALEHENKLLKTEAIH